MVAAVVIRRSPQETRIAPGVAALFPTRSAASELVAGPLESDADLYVRLRHLTDGTIHACQVHSEVRDCRITALLLLKARRVSDGILALVLDAIGQEAGALFRVLQEIWELLVYLEQDPARFQELAEDRKPSPGKIAKRIGGQFQALRDHLNEHAAHFALTADAMGHLVDLRTGSLRVESQVSEDVARQNIAVLFAVLLMSTGSAVVLLSAHDPVAGGRLASELDLLQNEGSEYLQAHDLGQSGGAGQAPGAT